MRGLVVITAHAVDQYIARVHPEMCFGEARTRLRTRSWRAVKLAERTPNGDEQWDVGDAVLVVGFDKADPRVRVAKTVIPPRTDRQPKLSEQLEAELRAALELAEREV